MIKWTLVTGGAKRLGAAICIKLAQKGHHILVHYHKSAKNAADVVAECKRYGVSAESIQGDFSTLQSTQKFIDSIQKRNIATLVLNVGNYNLQTATEISPEAWSELFQVNLHAPHACIRAFLPTIIKNKGNILTLGVSGLEGMRAHPKGTAYRLTKSSLLFLTKSLAKELANDDVRVNMVSPGYLDISEDKPEDESQLPMKRVGTVEEVVNVILFLLDNAYVTGQNIEVAGGIGL